MSAALKLNPQPNIKLVIQKGPHAGQRFSFNKSKINIGRSPENDIILINDPLISRQHAYIQVNDNDIEIINLSHKNPILINNENVNKWKLTHDTVFLIGDSEFLVQVEGPQSVVVMKPLQNPKPVSVGQLKVMDTFVQKTNTSSIPNRNPGQINPTVRPTFQQMNTPNPNPKRKMSLKDHPKFKFYAIFSLLLVGFLAFMFSEDDVVKKKKVPTLKYSDETLAKINTKEVKENQSKLERQILLKRSATYLRVEENFNKGMKAYQQNNFSNAIEFFQQALNTNSEHVLAKRYLQLSQIRFDEVVKAKLVLGQNYYESNNFKLCASMFKQVIEMLNTKELLQGQPKDTNLQLAEHMLKKCNFAAEGIH